MTIDRENIVGVVLAGGQSRRMGGGDKGLLAFGRATMLGHVINRFNPQVGRVLINANGDPARFEAFGLPIAADPIGGYVGPLAGVLAGMRWAEANAPAASHIATCSSDAPFLPCDLVDRLREAAAAAADGVIPIACSGGHLHPVIGLWPVRHAEDLETALARDGVRKVLRWTDRHGTVPVDFDPVAVAGRTVDPFFNANTPEELDQARQWLAGDRDADA